MQTKTFPKLYKKTVKGQLNEWSIEVSVDKYRTTYGKVGGKLQTTQWTVCEPTNVGRSNERNGHEQALSEAQALWDKQIEEGSAETVEALEAAPETFDPMLAHKFDAKTHGIYPCFSQVKLDGARCIAHPDKLLSRSAKEWVAVPHVSKALKSFFKDHPNVILDGELYNHSLRDNFEKIISLIRKTKPSEKDISEAEDKIQFHVYDVYLKDHPEWTFTQRMEWLKQHLFVSDVIQLVPTTLCADLEALNKEYQNYLAQGFEGQMVRNPNANYEQKRSKQLLKRKEFQDQEYKILDIIEGEGNKTGVAGAMVFENEQGTSFKSNIKGSREYLREIWDNKVSYIGQLATVRFFEKTLDNIPRFPYVYAIRNYE